MGIDTHIYLPNDVRLHDVAQIMGLLAGCKRSNEKYRIVEGVTYRMVPSIPEMPIIHLENENGLIDGAKVHEAYYHFEMDDANYRLIGVRPTRFWIAIGYKLIEFFGGHIDINDCDNKECNKRFKNPRKHNNPDDGKPYEDFEKAMRDIEPLTDKDLANIKDALYD